MASIFDEHDQSTTFVHQLVASLNLKPGREKTAALQACKEFLVGRNEVCTEIVKPNRTLVLMDATGSMGGLIRAAKAAVIQMFEDIHEQLRESGKKSNFQMQFACYRNYADSPQRLLQYSPWASNPATLKAYMNTISANGGYGIDEAGEIGLWHANNEVERGGLAQVMLIGDAPCNLTQAMVSHKRRLREWKDTEFADPVYYKTEVAKLKESGVPIHCFPVNKYCRTQFQEISDETGGECKDLFQLASHSKDGANLMKVIVVARVLEKLGGAELRENYKKKIKKTFGYLSDYC